MGVRGREPRRLEQTKPNVLITRTLRRPGWIRPWQAVVSATARRTWLAGGCESRPLSAGSWFALWRVASRNIGSLFFLLPGSAWLLSRAAANAAVCLPDVTVA